MAKGDELVKYITERVVDYVETPREVRRERKIKEPWANRWFGMIPFSLSLWMSQLPIKKRKKEEKSSFSKYKDM